MSATNMTEAPDAFDFIISPEPRHTNIHATDNNHVEMAFVVRNISGRTVRAEPLINPLPNSNQLAEQVVSPDLMIRYLQILNPQEWEFEHDAVRTYRVRLELPEGFRSDDYSFQLLIVGTDDPDNQVVASETVTFTVSGPALNPRPFLLAAVAILAAVILVAVGAALLLRPIAQLEVTFATSDDITPLEAQCTGDQGTPVNAASPTPEEVTVSASSKRIVEFAPPAAMTEGKVECYTLKITNLRQEPLDNLVMDYTLPAGLIGASAFVPNSLLRNCDESPNGLHCDLGSLQPDVPVFITIEVFPGPISEPLEIQHLKTMSFYQQETQTSNSHREDLTPTGQQQEPTPTQQGLTPTVQLATASSKGIRVDLPQNTSTLNPGSQDYYVAIDPAQRVALTGEELSYDILTWRGTKAVSPDKSVIDGEFLLTYELPHGLTYLYPLPSKCSQDAANYFELVCKLPSISDPAQAEKVARISVRAVAATAADGLIHKASLHYHVLKSTVPGISVEGNQIPVSETAINATTTSSSTCINASASYANLIPQAAVPTSIAQPTAVSVNSTSMATACTSAVSTALMFDGVGDWVELGFKQGWPAFTAEMWVHPFSTDDGQAFIGAHRQTPDSVDNMFLVGYYDGAFSITVNGEYHNLDREKIADRFHLAVVVQKALKTPDAWLAVVYINGEPQPWQEPETAQVCLDEGSYTNVCKIFKKPDTEKRLDDKDPGMPWVLGQDWDYGVSGPRSSDFLYGSMAEVRLWDSARTQGDILNTMRQRPHGDENHLVAYWRLEPVDLSSDNVIVPDRAGGHYPGIRHQASWDDITPRFGASLAFNGIDNSLSVDNLRLSDNFVADEKGKVKLTLAGWFYVDGVPTRQQWLLGSAVPGGGTSSLTQSGRSPADDALAAAQQARQALTLDPAEGRIALQKARDELYRTLDPLTGGFDPVKYNDPLTKVFDKKVPVEEQIPEAFTTDLGKLIKARGELPELMALQKARLDLDREQRQYEKGNGGDFETIRGKFRTEAARREYARLLAQVWQTYARDGVTVADVLADAPDLAAAQKFQAQLDDLEAGLERQTLPIRALNGLALVELYDENVAESLIAGDLVPESLQAQNAALTQSQNSLNAELDQNEAYLESLLGLQSTTAGGIQAPAATASGPNLPDPDLLGYWKFDEGSGSFTRAYPGKGELGSLTGGAAFISSTPALSASPFAMAFNGSTAAVSMDSPLPGTGDQDFTIAFWINPQNSGQVLDLGTTANNPGNITCSIIVARDGENLALTCTTHPIEFVENLGHPNSWVHVALRYSPAQKKWQVYFNGMQKQIPNGDLPPNPSGMVRLGFTDAHPAFTGLLDELLIYQRALSPEEIERLAGGPLPSEETVTQRLDALRAVQALRQAQSNLQQIVDADARLAEAQQAVDQSNAIVEPNGQVAIDAAKAEEDRKELEVKVTDSQASLASATSQVERTAAQKDLDQAQANLEAARQQQFEYLGSSIVLLRQREQILADLSPRLDEAVEKSVDAAQTALQRNNVELLVGPFLDFILGTRTPRKTSYQAAYPAALLAAQLALKPEVDGKVDAARARYNAAVEARDLLINSTGNPDANAETRQKIIDNINSYIDSVNRDVNQAQAELEQAVEEQRASQTDSKLQSALAEALAQTLAQRVASEIAARYPVNPGSTVKPDPRLAELIKARLKAELFSSLESVRRPVRLRMYYETYYAATRLDQELAAGIDQAQERVAKETLRGRLVGLNTALFNVLRAQNVLLRPAVGFDALLKQVADESDHATQLDQLIKALDTALKNASDALSVPVLGIRMPVLETVTTDNTAAPNATPVPGGGIGAAVSTMIPGTQATPSPDQTSGNQISATPTNSNQSNSDLTGSSSTGGGTIQTGASGSLNDGTSLFGPPPNIWAGLILTDDGHVAVVARPAGAATWAIRKDERPIPVGRWVHYAAVIVYDVQTGEIEVDTNGKIKDESLKLYRNGTSAKGNPAWAGPDEIRVGLTNCPANFYIGGLCAGANGYNFRGQIDDVRIWNRALQVQDIQTWLDLPGEASNEVAYWSYDDILGGVTSAPASCEAGENCDLTIGQQDCKSGQACDLAGNHNLNVIGPVWIPPDPHLLQNSTTR